MLKARGWSFAANPSVALSQTDLPIAKKAAGTPFLYAHDVAYWQRATRGYDFSGEDRIDAAGYSRVLWDGLKGRPTC